MTAKNESISNVAISAHFLWNTIPGTGENDSTSDSKEHHMIQADEELFELDDIWLEEPVKVSQVNETQNWDFEIIWLGAVPWYVLMEDKDSDAQLEIFGVRLHLETENFLAQLMQYHDWVTGQPRD